MTREREDFPVSLRKRATKSVLRVGDGRGFVISRGGYLFVITAAHCLPFLPPAMNASHIEERTYQKLIGPLGTEPTGWAECRFVDPVADIAVLGAPDDQALADQHHAFENIVMAGPSNNIAEAPMSGDAWVLSLDGAWRPCTVERSGFADSPLWVSGCTTEGGMSGSPILNSAGDAIGVVTTGNEGQLTVPSQQPNLLSHLPGWLLRS